MSEQTGKGLMIFGGCLFALPIVLFLAVLLISSIVSISWTTTSILFAAGVFYFLACVLCVTIGAVIYSRN